MCKPRSRRREILSRIVGRDNRRFRWPGVTFGMQDPEYADCGDHVDCGCPGARGATDIVSGRLNNTLLQRQDTLAGDTIGALSAEAVLPGVNTESCRSSKTTRAASAAPSMSRQGAGYRARNREGQASPPHQASESRVRRSPTYQGRAPASGIGLPFLGGVAGDSTPISVGSRDT